MLIVLGAKAPRPPKLHSRVWRDATSAPGHEQGLSTFYPVLDSLLIFAGIHSGAGYGYRQLAAVVRLDIAGQPCRRHQPDHAAPVGPKFSVASRMAIPIIFHPVSAP